MRAIIRFDPEFEIASDLSSIDGAPLFR